MTDAVKFVTEPEVYLVTRPQVDREAVARFLSAVGFPRRFADDHTHDAEQAIATGSRTCYQSFDSGRTPDEHIAHLIDVEHGSVLEHATFGVLIAGVSRSLSHELVRHRHLSPSQLSQRYVDHAEVRFVVPPALLTAHRDSESAVARDTEVMRWLDTQEGKEALADRSQWTFTTAPPLPPLLKAYYHWNQFCVESLGTYREVLSGLESVGLHGKAAREAARSTLPNCTETRLLVTGNLRAWRVFFERRCSPHADAEIRRLACRTFDVISPHAPAVFADYEIEPLGDGTFQITTEHQRV